MAENLKRIMATTLQIMQEDEKTRSSDSLLYYKVLEVYAEAKGIDIHTMTVPELLLEMYGDLPPFESVRRSRQKIQVLHPDLRAAPEVQRMRMEQEQEYFLLSVDDAE